MTFIRAGLLALATMAMPLSASATSAVKPPARADWMTAAITEIIAMEARVAPLAARLARSGARWCPLTMPTPGWLLGDRRLYADDVWPMVRTAYGAADSDSLFIAALDPDGAAARAGLRVGDSISGIDGMAATAIDDSPHGRIAWSQAMLADLPATMPLEVHIARLPHAVRLPPAPGCASEFRVEAYDAVKAQADGTVVYIPGGMVRFAVDDEQLATVIAHELAHNILRHRERLDAAKIDRGLGQQFGRSARLTRATEIEADRLSVWLLVDAGFDPGAAARFWTSYGKRRGGGIFAAPTHPKWRERVRIVTEEAALLRRLRAADPVTTPPLVANPQPLE
jgi:beta-barrel assembly-enhancing protease